MEMQNSSIDKKTIKIDNEFQELLPDLTKEVYKLLEKHILEYGYDETKPIITWKNIIIDGHHRYEISKKHGIEFTIISKNFDNRESVKYWIITSQIAGRRITDDEETYLLGIRYKLEKLMHGGDRKTSTKHLINEDKSRGNGSPLKLPIQIDNSQTKQNKTAEKIAKELGIDPKTVKNAEKYTDAINEITKNTGISRGDITSGKIKSTQIHIKKLAQASPIKQQKVIDIIEKKEAKDIKQAIKIVEKQEIEEATTIDDIIVEEPKIKTKTGEWYQLNRHRLYCGSNNDKEFQDRLVDFNFVFAFADPPYNANTGDDWDKDFIWQQDWLINYSPIVAITPGIVSIQDFMKKTTMPYVWSMAGWIANGHARGALGFGNWIYIALFSNGSVYKNSQDFIKINMKFTEYDASQHKGRKPSGLLASLLNIFSEKDQFILDPFLGSGTTLLVSEKMDRICIGAEIEPKYCDEIIAKWQTLTSNKVSRL